MTADFERLEARRFQRRYPVLLFLVSPIIFIFSRRNRTTMYGMYLR